MADLFDTPGAAAETSGPRPLADRLRPKTLGEVVGQGQVLGPEAPLGVMLSSGSLSSLILWGPPGVGKTTIARLLADESDLHFVQISAIFTGVPELRKVFEAARHRRANGQGTLLFVDEIHRFNKAQQDGFLPHMEDGTILLVGATTENPSFELNAALLSRAQVLVLERLSPAELELLTQRAEKELGRALPLTEEARELAWHARGVVVAVRPLGEAYRVEVTARDGHAVDEAGARPRAAALVAVTLLEHLGALREDLFYRLKVIQIRIPPLRERKDDVLPLARFFLKKMGARLNRDDLTGFDPSTANLMLHHSWPGNVRELENAVEHAVVLASESRIKPEDLPEELHTQTVQTITATPGKTLEEVEKDYILATLETNGGNQTKTAQQLGIGTATLYRKLRKYEK